MSREMTATEVSANIAEWARVNQPRYEAMLTRIFTSLFPRTFWMIEAHMLDNETQQQRMTDDGCPL